MSLQMVEITENDLVDVPFISASAEKKMRYEGYKEGEVVLREVFRN